jgi:antitoxin component YwqK of YwqJK toxin-antitoxin module
MKTPDKEHIQYHKDGSIWAQGKMRGEKPVGYWEWFRKDGTKLRSGNFDLGVQTGEWTTYDKKGAVYKVTLLKPNKSKTPAKKKRVTPQRKVSTDSRGARALKA